MDSMETKVNDTRLDEYVAYMARVLVEQYDNLDDAQDVAHEYADQSEWVIYTARAHELCQNCNTDLGEEFLADVGAKPESYDAFATQIAYGEVYGRIMRELYKLDAEGAFDKDDEEAA